MRHRTAPTGAHRRARDRERDRDLGAGGRRDPAIGRRWTRQRSRACSCIIVTGCLLDAVIAYRAIRGRVGLVAYGWLGFRILLSAAGLLVRDATELRHRRRRAEPLSGASRAVGGRRPPRRPDDRDRGDRRPIRTPRLTGPGRVASPCPWEPSVEPAWSRSRSRRSGSPIGSPSSIALGPAIRAGSRRSSRPTDLGLPYETTTVRSGDLDLPAWFIPARGGAPGPGVVLVHGWESARDRTLPMAALPARRRVPLPDLRRPRPRRQPGRGAADQRRRVRRRCAGRRSRPCWPGPR